MPWRALGNTSIRTRLTGLLMLASTLSVMLAAGIISVMGYYNLRNTMRAELQSTARMVGERNLGYLGIGDVEASTRNLQIIGINPTLRLACLYDQGGHLFTFHSTTGGDASLCPPAPSQAGLGERKGRLTVAQNVGRRESARIGTVYLESDRKPLLDYIRKQVTMVVTMLVLVSIAALLLSLTLQTTISTPVLELADVARTITRNKDYSLRAGHRDHPLRPDNEIDILVEAFNNMLSEIGARERELLDQAEELRRARDAAEGANRSKSQFLANISHELRTPLNAIIGFSSILVNQLFGPMGNGKYVEYAKDINDSGTHLLDIINDILDLSKAEAGKLMLSFEEINVEKAVAKCLGILAERASEGGVMVRSELPKKLPPLTADRLRFIQILLNVLSNAVKFTEPGGTVTIRAECEDYGPTEPGSYIISIRDTGIGMEPEDIQKAFQSFGQVDSDLNRKYEGTGLGLPLTKKLMELHSGDIWLQSTPGEGTTATLRFRTMPSSQQTTIRHAG